MVGQSIEALLETVIDGQFESHLEKDYSSSAKDGDSVVGMFYVSFRDKVTLSEENRAVLEALKTGDFISGSFSEDGKKYLAFDVLRDTSKAHKDLDARAMAIRSELLSKGVSVYGTASFIVSSGSLNDNVVRAEELVRKSNSQTTHFHDYK